MAEIVLAKAMNGALVPLDPQGVAYVARMKLGAAVTATLKRHNNPAFHRKLFALFNYAFDCWEPASLQHKGQPVQKNFDRFRKDLTVLAGFYDVVVNLKGEVRAEAKSLNFGHMEHDEREQLYSAVIDAVLAMILTHSTRADLDALVEQLLRFD